jgi:hypothetical protein
VPSPEPFLRQRQGSTASMSLERAAHRMVCSSDVMVLFARRMDHDGMGRNLFTGRKLVDWLPILQL